MKGYAIYHQLKIKSSLDEVFEAITDPQHLINWWPLKCTGKPKNGEIYNFNFTDKFDWHGRVVSVLKNQHFYVKMTNSDQNWNPTSFGFDLKENPNGTTLNFWHKNWRDCNDEFKQSSFCWAILLQGLRSYLETGHITPFTERE